MSHSHDTARAVNALTVSSALTMSSREIAEVTGKEHSHVIRDIRAMLAKLRDDPELVHVVESKDARDYTALISLPKSLTLTLVAGYNIPMRKRIIDRWLVLEEAARPKFEIPTTLSSALRLAAEQAERIEQQAQQLEAAKPAVEFVGRYVDSTGSKTFRQVCKLLKANEARFREFLQDWKIMYRLGGEWTPYAEHLDAGRFEVKAGTSETTQHAFNQAKFTPKGIAWVAGLWAKHQLESNQDEGARCA